MLVGKVVDELLKVCGGMVRGDDMGKGRGRLDGVLGVLIDGEVGSGGGAVGPAVVQADMGPKAVHREEVNGNRDDGVGAGAGGWL